MSLLIAYCFPAPALAPDKINKLSCIKLHKYCIFVILSKWDQFRFYLIKHCLHVLGLRMGSLHEINFLLKILLIDSLLTLFMESTHLELVHSQHKTNLNYNKTYLTHM